MTGRTPDFRLDGEVAFVTGAGSGIGRALALGIAGSGASVACVDLEGHADTAAMITGLGGRAAALTADVTDPGRLAAAVEMTESSLGHLTLAVNCAGIADAAPAEEMALQQWQRVVDIDQTGVFLCCQAEARAMLGRGRGAIVNIASMSGSIVNRGLRQVHYNAAKAAVVHLSRSLAMEWAHRGLRVNTVSPGYTATPMNTRSEVAEQARRFEQDTPLGRMAAPEEIVGPVVFLLSGASSFVTGIDLLVDGGFTCW